MTVKRDEVQIHGLEELTRTLKALPNELTASSRGGILALALRDIANMVKKDVIADAPVGTGEEYVSFKGQKIKVEHGRLKRAVRVRRDKNPHLVGMTENIQIKMYKGRSRLDKNAAWFWFMVNFGTEKQAPQPFFTGAFDKNQTQMIPTFEKGMDKRLKTAIRKAKKHGFELNYE